MAAPWMAQSYVYVPGVLNVTAYVELASLITTLFRKIGDPVDWTVCGVPLSFQVQVTVLPAATVSTAGFWLPL
ncbi:MAG TPA: hypothetical protein VGV12_09000 [Gemmatimonadales bacterium]|nr:hypothetical protein [Gemmatimonadales bacterium]